MLKPKEVSQILDVSVKTLQRWDAKGILVAQRTGHNRRFYSQDQIDKFLQNNSERLEIVSLKGLTSRQQAIIKDLLTDFRKANQVKQ